MQGLSLKTPPGDSLRNCAAPQADCPRCPRLAAFRWENRRHYPDFFNNPVPSFGSLEAGLLVVGLAPGLQGANWSGRPFTGDWAGDTLYGALLRHGLARGTYAARPDDGLQLVNCRITNAVRCVPPENKPTGEEINQCRDYLTAEIKAMPKLKVILSLGTVSHQSVCRVLGARVAEHPFGHGAEHIITPPWRSTPILLLDSYHCSRYNTNTGRLTQAMFESVVARAAALLRV